MHWAPTEVSKIADVLRGNQFGSAVFVPGTQHYFNGNSRNSLRKNWFIAGVEL